MRTLLGFTAVAVCFIGVALQYMLGSKDVRQQALQACSMLEEQSLQQQCIANSLNHNVSIESSQPSEVSEHRAAWSPLVLLAVVLAAAVLLLRQDGNDLHHRLLAGVLRLDMERYGGLTPWSVLTYKVDVWFSSHPFSKLILLLVLTLSLIILGGISLFLVSGHDLYNSVWAAVAGAGLDWTFFEHAQHQIAVRLVSLMISIGGMLITALLLGIVSDAIGRKVDELKRGRSAVLEFGHTLILGWSEKIYCLLEQLCMGHELSGGKPIVILSDKDKEEMEEDIARANIQLRGSVIICRKGDPMSAAELHKVSVIHASSIVILADQSDPDLSDARTLRTVLCLMGLKAMGAKGGKPTGLKGTILAEMCHSDHEKLLLQLAGGPRVRTVVSRETIGRLMVQCVRLPALTHVLKELLGFDGNEFYITHVPQLVGRSFGSLQPLFPNAIPMGLKQKASGLLLNPPMDTVVEEGDELVLLAEDETHLAPDLPTAPAPRHSLFQSLRSFHIPGGRTLSGSKLAETIEAALRKGSAASPAVSESEGPAPGAGSQGAVAGHGPSRLGGGLAKPALASQGLVKALRGGSQGGVAGDAEEKEGEQAGVPAVPQKPGPGSPESVLVSSELPSMPSGGAGASTSSGGGAAAGDSGLLNISRAGSFGRQGSLGRQPSLTRQGSLNRQGSLPRSGSLPRAGSMARGAVSELEPVAEGRVPSSPESAGKASPTKSPWDVEGPATGSSWGGLAAAAGSQGGDAPRSARASIGALPTDVSGGGFRRQGSMPRRGTVTPNFGRGSLNAGSTMAPGSSLGASGMAFGGRFLFCGWRNDLPGLVRVLDEFCTLPSELWLLSQVPIDERAQLLAQGGLEVASDGSQCELQNLRLVWDDPRLCGSLLLKRQLQLLYPLQFTAILILAEEPGTGSAGKVSDIDSRSLATLMLLRQIQVEDLRTGRLEPPPPPISGGVANITAANMSAMGTVDSAAALAATGYAQASGMMFQSMGSGDLGAVGGPEVLMRGLSGDGGEAWSRGGAPPQPASAAPAASGWAKLRSTMARRVAAAAPPPLDVASEPSLVITPPSNLLITPGGTAVVSAAAPSAALMALLPEPHLNRTKGERTSYSGNQGASLRPASLNTPEADGERPPSSRLSASTTPVSGPLMRTPSPGLPSGLTVASGSRSPRASQSGLPPSGATQQSPLLADGSMGALLGARASHEAAALPQQMPSMYGHLDHATSMPRPGLTSKGPFMTVPGLQQPQPGMQMPLQPSPMLMRASQVRRSMSVAPAHTGIVPVASMAHHAPHRSSTGLLPPAGHALPLSGGLMPGRASISVRPGMQDDEDDDDDDDDSEEWQSSDSDDPIGLLKKQHRAASRRNLAAEVPVNGDGAEGEDDEIDAAAVAQDAAAHATAAGSTSPGSVAAKGRPTTDDAADATAAAGLAGAAEAAVEAGASALRTLHCRRSTSLGMHVPHDGQAAGAAAGAAGSGPARLPPQSHDGSQALHGGAGTNTAGSEAQDRAVGAGSTGGGGGTDAAPAPVRSGALGPSLRSVAQAAIMARRVAGVGRRARGGSVREDLARPGTGKAAAAEEGDSLFSAMTSLAVAGGKKKGRGRKSAAASKQSAWLQELQQACTHSVIVSELLEAKSYEMVKDLHVAQYVLSNELISQLLALLALMPERADIFDELFSPGGNELYTRPARWLLAKEELVSFNELSSRAIQQGEVLLGYITRGSRETMLNPPEKSVAKLARSNVELLVTIAWS